MKCRPAFLLLSLTLLSAAVPSHLFSLSLDEIDVSGSLLFVGSNPNPQPSDSTDPSLGIVPSIGVSAPLKLAGPFFIEPALDLLGWWYRWNPDAGAAEITQSDNGIGFFTLGAVVSLQGGAAFPVATSLSLGGTVGLDFFLRLPAEFQNSVKSDQAKAISWFYGAGRFFYPETRVFLRWRISDPIDLLVNIRAFYPVFHLWDNAGQPFWDSLMVSAGVAVGIRLKAAPAGKGAAPK